MNDSSSIRHSVSNSELGLWVYLMTDCLLFASLFATFAVLRNNTFGGLSGGELFNMPYILVETLILLTSSFTIGLAVIASYKRQSNPIYIWTVITLLLGITFFSMELYEFRELVANGNGWSTNAFLSSYFTLLATHGIHILIGIVWIVFLIIQRIRRGLSSSFARRLAMLGMFWHFLDIIWIFIFTFVYLLGAIK